MTTTFSDGHNINEFNAVYQRGGFLGHLLFNEGSSKVNFLKIDHGLFLIGG